MGSTLSNPVDHRNKALQSLEGLPPFSPILAKLLASLAADDVSFGKLAELIEKDTVLSGNVLRLMNSALYGRRGTISSVRHAVSLMGLVKLRNTVMMLNMSQMWNQVRMPKGWNSARFNQHAVGTAVMADLLAQRVETEYPEGAFVAGLLHDIGLLLVGVAFPEEFAAIRRVHEEQRRPLHECEEEVLGLAHAEISAAALNEWNLPEPVRRAVRYQNEPARRTGEEYPLSWVLHAADRGVDQLELSVLPEAANRVDNPAGILAPLGLESHWDQLAEQFEQEFAPMKSFF